MNTQSPPRSRSSRTAILALLIGGGALVVILVVVLVVRLSTPSADEPPASELAEKYLRALAEGDADTALSLVSIGLSGNENHLTNEVLSASLSKAPVESIAVEEVTSTSGSAEVPVAFTIGGQPVAQTLTIHDMKDEGRRITNGVYSVELPTLQGLEPSVNGVPAGANFTVFPGSYAIELGVDEFSLPKDAQQVTIASSEQSIAVTQVRPELSEDGLKEFRSLIRSSFEECLAMTDLSTPCGMDITDVNLPAGYTPVPDSVKRTLTPEGDKKLGELEAKFDSMNPTVVSGLGGINVDITFEADKGGTRVPYETFGPTGQKQPSVDFGTDAPKVEWK